MKRAGWALAVGSALLLAQAAGPGSGARVLAQGSEAAATPTVADTAVSADELRQLAKGLAAPSSSVRAAAFETLSGLGEDALPAIATRLTRLGSAGFDAAATLEAMAELRRHAGAELDDARVDLRDGVLPALALAQKPALVLASELVALLRALEAQKSPEATELIVGKLFALDSKLFRFEAPRTQRRLGALIIPAAIRFRAHPRSWVRKFCLETLDELHVAEPGRAVQQDDVALLAAILGAYGDTLTFDAMPVVVSYIGDERSEVRAAAQRAVTRFGKNAIWQLRERYLNTTGKEADPGWGHQRLSSELARWFEAPKRELVDQQLTRADAALARGDFGGAEAALDKALVAAPFGAAAQRAAPLYVRIAGHHEANDQLEPAIACLRRALRLDPTGAEYKRALARVKYLEAELRLSRGQVDLKGYEEALRLDPGLSEAQATLDELSGKNRERERERQKALALLAALVLGVAGCLALRGKRGSSANQASGEARDETAGAAPSA